ncbi:hypothetical protein ACQEWB_38170 [Streptomyces sp. CA-249302]|uniref:hypothetical protein n=1 Tax=Streptomyces sp. CA-249302 TaxID=3240058 RepID=UPI003D8F1BF7
MTAGHLAPELVEHPAGSCADLRSRPGLAHAVLPGLDAPVRSATRHEDVKAALTEPRLVRDRSSVPDSEMPDPQAELLAQHLGGLPPEYARYLSGHLALFDGAEHTRRRNPLAGHEQADLLGEFAYGDGSRVLEGRGGIVEFALDLVARRRGEPAGDLVSALLADGGTGDDEIVTVFFLLIDTGITPPALFLARAVPELLRYGTLVRMGATLQ